MKDEDADILFAEFAANVKRFEVVDYMNVMSAPAMQFVIAKANIVAGVSWTTFIKPLHWKIWLCLLLTICIATIVVWILQKYPEKVLLMCFKRKF